jgi:hypothetical protein
MKEFTTFFLLLVAVTIFYVYLETKSLDVVYVESNLSGKEPFKVLVRNLDDSQEAANLLAKIRENLVKLVEYTSNEKNFKENKKEYEEYKEALIRMKNNFRPDNISESSPNNNYTSYSINKGEKIVFCIRSKTSGELVDINTMMFVAIHEMGHLMSESIGHTQEFWKNMKYLLHRGEEIDIYNHKNYSEDSVEYCGTMITDTPY